METGTCLREQPVEKPVLQLVGDGHAARAAGQCEKPWTAQRRLGVALLGGGLVMIVIAILGVRVESEGASEQKPAAAIGAASPGTEDHHRATVQATTYAPGQKGDWHTHAGVHVVAVIAGVLTVYDSSCQPAVYRAGEAYVGGTLPHLAVNDTDEPVHMLVTYTFEHAPASEELTLPATPPACAGGPN